MSQYEIEYLQKKYELRQAEIALEEAQNAKDQVRLARNASGGWGYIYTANQDNVDSARQTYEDRLYAMQEFNQKTIEEAQSTWLQLNQEFAEAMAQVQDPEKAAEIEAYYTERMANLSRVLGLALENNA